MKPDNFKPATAEALDYSGALQAAIEAVSMAHVAQGKQPNMRDPLSALMGIVGSFVAGAPEGKIRDDMLVRCDRLLRIAVEQSLAFDTAQHVQIIKKEQAP